MLRPLFLISFVFYHLLLVMINMTVWSCHVTYVFQSESTPYYSLNVKELLARSRREIRSLSDCNWNRTQNHLVRKQTLSHLAQLVKVSGWVFVYELSGSGFKSSCSRLNFRFRACFEQGVPWYSGNYRVWIHSKTRTWHDKNMQSAYKFGTIIQSSYYEGFNENQFV